MPKLGNTFSTITLDKRVALKMAGMTAGDNLMCSCLDYVLIYNWSRAWWLGDWRIVFSIPCCRTTNEGGGEKQDNDGVSCSNDNPNRETVKPA